MTAQMFNGQLRTIARVFVGYDSREAAAYGVCAKSLARRSSWPIDISALNQKSLRALGIYTREPDERASTEFSLTRFLVPYLAGFEGWAVYCDGDFLWQDDIDGLLAYADDLYAVLVVKHDHRTAEKMKMDGQVQAAYPRKNWSSLMLFNCAHPSARTLTLGNVNLASPAFLHQFGWCCNEAIGALPERWNWLAGVSPTTTEGRLWKQAGEETPGAIHYTLGGPWLPEYHDGPFAPVWRNERAAGPVDELTHRRLAAATRDRKVPRDAFPRQGLAT